MITFLIHKAAHKLLHDHLLQSRTWVVGSNILYDNELPQFLLQRHSLHYLHYFTLLPLQQYLSGAECRHGCHAMAYARFCPRWSRDIIGRHYRIGTGREEEKKTAKNADDSIIKYMFISLCRR